MKSSRAGAIFLSAVTALTSVPAAHAADASPPDSRPLASSDEAGLWMLADENEEHIKTSPLLVRDPGLNDYVHGVVCKVATTRCASLRVYIVKVPFFNAYAMPNGAVVVWTGLLLRVENEAQLAMVLGHEMTHYFNRHGLKNFETQRDTRNAMAFLGLGGLYAAPILLIAAGMLQSYSRDQEREADAGGFDLATAAGYDPTQAAAIWGYMAEEDKQEPHHNGLFGSTHPTDEERLTTLSKRGTELSATAAKWTTGAEDYHAHVLSFRHTWLEDDMTRGNGKASVVMLERLTKAEPDSGLLQYYLGEAYRRRNTDGDAQRAIAAYTSAAAKPDVPPQTWRELGLIAMKSGDTAGARADFAAYLAHAPNADDRAMVEFYMTKVGGS